MHVAVPAYLAAMEPGRDGQGAGLAKTASDLQKRRSKRVIRLQVRRSCYLILSRCQKTAFDLRASTRSADRAPQRPHMPTILTDGYDEPEPGQEAPMAVTLQSVRRTSTSRTALSLGSQDHPARAQNNRTVTITCPHLRYVAAACSAR